LKECLVKQYCMYQYKRGICRECKEYNKFNREKNAVAVAMGIANKRKGKKSEQKLLLHFQRQDLEARIIEGSGAYKKARKDADSDLRVVIKGKERKVENKKRQGFGRLRQLLEKFPILRIKGFCYIMTETLFYELLKAKAIIPTSRAVIYRMDKSYKRKIHSVADHQFGWLHKFFEQDNADIVSLDESYKEFIFCITEPLFEEIVPAVKA